MKVENARVVGYNHDVAKVYAHSGRHVANTEGDITLEVLLPRGYLDSLPEGFAERKVTLMFAPTPGEAAYLRHQDSHLDTARGVPWERMTKAERMHWEEVALAAIKAK